MEQSTPLNQAAAPAKPRRGRKFLKYALYAFAALIAVAAIAHVVWNRSGSGQWELAIDQDGVKVWSMKNPGNNLVRIKAAVRIKSSLAGMVKLLEDLESCVDAHCYDAKVLQSLDTPPGQYAAYVRFKFDIPGMATRDYVLFQEHFQDPQTKKLEINLIAAPNKIPRDDCCIRVTHLHNNWKITPLPGGELDIEFMQDTDVGGMHYLPANLALTHGTHEILRGMQALMDMDKYRTAQVPTIQELAAN